MTNEGGSDRPPLTPDDPLFAELFAVSPVPAVVSSLRDNSVLAINERTAAIFGVPPEAAVGLKVTDYYVNPADRQRLAERVKRDGKADGLRVQVRRQSGETFWASLSARLVTCGGEPAVFTVFTDISDQVAAERSLGESERRISAQSRALTGLMARYADPEETFEDRLRSILVITAQTLHVERISMWRFENDKDQLRCDSLYELSANRHQSGTMLHRGDTPAYFAALETDRMISADDARTDARTRDFLDWYLEPNDIGAMLDVPLRRGKAALGVLCAEHVGSSRIWTADEQHFAIAAANLIVVAIADEERRNALTKLAESEATSRLVVDTAHDAFIGLDSDGLIVMWNAQAERTFGWTREEAMGRSLAETIVPPAFREAHIKGMDRFHRTGEAPVINQRLELSALHRTGREFPIEITITAPMLIDQGFFFGAFLRDISDRRERDDQLRLAKETAEAATRAKSEFLANMSHELRTPLNSVLGYAQILQRDRSLSASQREALKAISKGGSHLLDLINDVLDLSKIEAGRVEIENTTVDLARLAIDLKYLVAESVRRKGLLLTIALAPDVPRRVMLDGRHLRQVLLNLLGNAIKFTERGEVRMSIGRADDTRLLFEVSDTGVGIEPEGLTAIFEAFTQTKTGAAAGGTGLGLTISQHLISKMGGALQVDSIRGRGSRFFFALPLVASSDTSTIGPSDAELAAPPLDARLADGEHVSALVVDDSPMNCRILAGLLEAAGVHVITAGGGFEAVRLAHDYKPDVIFMDLKMPDLDGYEATRRIAADTVTADIPVIAVTASAFGDTRTAAQSAGCIDYLPKPVRAESLFGALQQHLGVQFVTGSDNLDDSGPIEIPRRLAIATRLRDAVALGDVTDLEKLAQELMAGEVSEVALGRRISRLATNFDFDGVTALAAALVGVDGTAS
jgi:PAS domain S-box-containing protein